MGYSRAARILVVLLTWSAWTLVACSSDSTANVPCGGFEDSDAADRSGFTDVRADWAPQLRDDWEAPVDVPLMNISGSDDAAVLGGKPQRFSAIRQGASCDAPFKRHQTVDDERMDYQIHIFFKNYGSGNAISNETRVALIHPDVLYGRKEIKSVIWSDNSAIDAASSSVVLTVPSGDPPVSLDVTDATVYMANGNKYSLNPDEFHSPRGAPIGCYEAGGEIHPVDDCYGYILATVKLSKVSSETSVQASPDAEKYSNSYTATSPGDTFLIKLAYKNSSAMTLRKLAIGFRLTEQQRRMFNYSGELWFRTDGGDWQHLEEHESGYTFAEVAPNATVDVVAKLSVRDTIWSEICSTRVTVVTGMFSREGAYAASDSLAIYPNPSSC